MSASSDPLSAAEMKTMFHYIYELKIEIDWILLLCIVSPDDWRECSNESFGNMMDHLTGAFVKNDKLQSMLSFESVIANRQTPKTKLLQTHGISVLRSRNNEWQKLDNWFYSMTSREQSLLFEVNSNMAKISSNYFVEIFWASFHTSTFSQVITNNFPTLKPPWVRLTIEKVCRYFRFTIILRLTYKFA